MGMLHYRLMGRYKEQVIKEAIKDRMSLKNWHSEAKVASQELNFVARFKLDFGSHISSKQHNGVF